MEGRDAVNRADFASCVDPHYPGLVRRLTLVLHDGEEAKDMAQETYLRAFRAWDRFEGGDVRAWLHTIGLRLAFSALRRRRLWSRLATRTGGVARPGHPDSDPLLTTATSGNFPSSEGEDAAFQRAITPYAMAPAVAPAARDANLGHRPAPVAAVLRVAN